jgi:hypothetical protein
MPVMEVVLTFTENGRAFCAIVPSDGTLLGLAGESRYAFRDGELKWRLSVFEDAARVEFKEDELSLIWSDGTRTIFRRCNKMGDEDKKR